MLFTEEFLVTIDENPVAAISYACNESLNTLSKFGTQAWTPEEHEILMETSALIDLIVESNDLHSDYSIPESISDINQDCKQLSDYITAVKNEFMGKATELKIKIYKNRYRAFLKSSFSYEFSQGDLNRIQTLINELRSHIEENTNLEPNHKLRRLKRLENLQSELHKRVSNLDSFWGMVGDAGIVLGKLGKDAKPIVDRIKEMSEIVWRTQARTEELPSDSPNPMLEHNKNA